VALAAIFFLLFLWRMNARGLDILSAVFIAFSGFFLFYLVNYRTLIIHLTPESLTLGFGLFTWEIPLDNIEDCRLDEIPLLMKYGGAGIHFMFIRGRYRASFNFLEHPRVVIALKRKRGMVQDVSFTTRQPDAVIEYISGASSSVGTSP
jgi:hypothetical protein